MPIRLPLVAPIVSGFRPREGFDFFTGFFHSPVKKVVARKKWQGISAASGNGCVKDALNGRIQQGVELGRRLLG